MTDDAHLTDHEWRLKMAAEGKAFYLPGKTAEEMKAEKEAQRSALAKEHKVTISLTGAEIEALDTAPDVIEELIHGLPPFFELMEDAERVDPGFSALLMMLRHHLDAVALKELDLLTEITRRTFGAAQSSKEGAR